MSEDLTHYDVLGVEPSADKDAVRDAYQARLAEVQADVQREQSAKKPDQGSIDGFRREEASVRSAWQVLSDPYQRGRYDATLEMGGAPDDDGAFEDDEVAEDRTPVRAGGRDRRDRQPYQRPPGMFSPEPLPKPASWPPDVQPPPSRARSIAMIIDLVVLFFLFNGLSVAGRAYVDDQYPKETTRLEHIVDCFDDLNAEEDRDRTTIARIERVESNRDCRLSNVKFSNKSNVEARLDEDTDRITDKYADVDKKRAGAQIVVQLLIIVALLLYLVPSSVLTGRTLGKRLMQIRAVNQDGSRLRLRGAMLRYALPVIAGMMLSTFLGAAMPGLQSFAFIIVLFVVMSWPRNPNLQGMHDRIAKTIVVDG